jgi:hypothetical protein
MKTIRTQAPLSSAEGADAFQNKSNRRKPACKTDGLTPILPPLERVREARDRGLPVYTETCPQYLYLSLEDMDKPGFESAKYVFTPPLREKWHQEKLWTGLKQYHYRSSPRTIVLSASDGSSYASIFESKPRKHSPVIAMYIANFAVKSHLSSISPKNVVGVVTFS